MITVVLADDQVLLRDGMQTIINLQDDMRVAGAGGDGERVYELVSRLRPDVVLMDIQMPVMDGIECTRKIKADFPDTIVLILTTYAEDDYIVESFQAGANGFLMKDLPGDRLAQSIRDAVSGQLMLPSAVAAKLVSMLKPTPGAASARLSASRLQAEGIVLSQREKEIAELLAEGRNNKQIARQLFMSEGTVRNYISGIYNKIGTSDREHAINILKQLM